MSNYNRIQNELHPTALGILVGRRAAHLQMGSLRIYIPVERTRDTLDSYGNVKSRKHGMIDNRAGLTISTKAIGAAEQNWMLEFQMGEGIV